MPKIIAIMGAPQSGKTEVAKYLERRHGFHRMSFLTPSHRMVRALGCTFEDVDGVAKRRPHPLLNNRSPYEVAQALALSWSNAVLGEEAFTDLFLRDLGKPTRNVVVDDLSQVSEARAIKKLGGVVWCVCAPNRERASREVQEAIELIDFDRSVLNNQGIKELFRGVEGLIQDMKGFY